MRLTWLIVCFIGGTSGFQFPRTPAHHFLHTLAHRFRQAFPSLADSHHRKLEPPKIVDIREPFIEITVSPLASEEAIRILDISWNVGCEWRTGDWVGLYSREPSGKSDDSLYSGAVTTSKGWLRTGIQEKRMFPVVARFEKICLGYWAVYWGALQDRPVAITCLMTNPTWMEDNWDDIKDLRVNEVFLPGTHDAGAYFLRYKPFSPGRYDKFIYNQDESILEQLIHGSRYLDLRIANYPKESGSPATSYWINHELIRIGILMFVLDDILLFLENTREIVVMDLHSFPIGFNDKLKTHEEFRRHLESKLGHHMAPFTGFESTLEDIRNSGRRLIVAHSKPEIACRYPGLFWRPIPQRWGNVARTNDLKVFLSKEMEGNHSAGMWAAMAELTLGAMGIVTDLLSIYPGGLKASMDTCNHNVTEWFRDSWGKRANIVAVDFIRSTGVVSAAIRWNREKGRGNGYEPRFRPVVGFRSQNVTPIELYRWCTEELKVTDGEALKAWWQIGRKLQNPR